MAQRRVLPILYSTKNVFKNNETPDGQRTSLIEKYSINNNVLC